jgi:hypothetical protein
MLETDAAGSGVDQYRHRACLWMSDGVMQGGPEADAASCI